MLNVEVKTETILNKDGTKRNDNYIIVNGIEVRGNIHTNAYYVFLYDNEVIDILNNCSFQEVSKFIRCYSFTIDIDFGHRCTLTLDIISGPYYDSKYPCIKGVLLLQDIENWDKPWSISKLRNEFEESVKEQENEKFIYWQREPHSMTWGFGFQYLPTDASLIIESELTTALQSLSAVITKTKERLSKSVSKHSILTYFHFPPEIKTACIQYLVYFTQFMADLDIIVNTELKEELDQTLFKVTPQDKNQSLEQIKMALELYLTSVGEKNFETEISGQMDIAARQWEANIYHLKSQLLLNRSIIQSQQATIETLQLSNYQYRQILESQPSKQKDEEQVIKGIVAVTKLEGKGFTINLPEIFRRLKRTFNKNS